MSFVAISDFEIAATIFIYKLATPKVLFINYYTELKGRVLILSLHSAIYP